jgi:hypothetical protein
MWWIFGLINVAIVSLFAWFYSNEVKDGGVWTREDKIAIGLLGVLAFFGGTIVSIGIAGLFVYLIVDFIKFVNKDTQK